MYESDYLEKPRSYSIYFPFAALFLTKTAPFKFIKCARFVVGIFFRFRSVALLTESCNDYYDNYKKYRHPEHSNCQKRRRQALTSKRCNKIQNRYINIIRNPSWSWRMYISDTIWEEVIYPLLMHWEGHPPTRSWFSYSEWTGTRF